MFTRMTTDARAVIARVPRLVCVDEPVMTRWHLAQALATPSGNTAELWNGPAAQPSPVDGPPSPPVNAAARDLRFDRETRQVLEQALRLALGEGAAQIGTEHLLAALVRTGPSDIVAWLAARGASAEAVDALLARLHGGPGVERLAERPSRTDGRRWRRLAAAANGGRPVASLLTTVAILVAVMLVLLVVCAWGP
jgi:ATP-dependent Clp protease ATP-binding subunit ClpA